jgi:type IV pilus assembly protein PilV
MNENPQTGFSLVEVLISILIVSIGILGSSAMELIALRTTQESGFQTVAFQLAAEISNQIRMSKAAGSQATRIVNAYLSVDYQAEVGPVSTSTQCLSINSNCQPIELANFNISQWEQRIQATLPMGRLVICRDADPWDAGRGQFKWACGGTPSGRDNVAIKIGWQSKASNGASPTDASRERPPLVVLATAL